MLTSLADILNWRVRLEEARHPVADLLFDAEPFTLTYLSVDTGGWLDRESVLVAAALMGEIDPAEGEIALSASAEDIRTAPRLDDDDALGRMLATMPPLVVGPFGATHAPLAMAAELAPERASPPKDSEDDRARKLVTRYESVRDWIGAEVFGADGALGTLASLLWDPERNRITHLVIDNDRVLAGKLLAVPAEVLRHRATGGHLVLDTTRAALDTAPQMHDLDELEHRGAADLHAHFVPPV